MEHGLVPHFPSIVLVAGPAGSGKTNFMAHMLMTEHFYGKSYEGMQTHDEKGSLFRHLERKPYFDVVILLMGSTDDMYDQLYEDGVINIKVYNPKEADVQHIIDTQEGLIREAGGDILKAPKLLIICDDILGNAKLMNCEPFRILSTKNRHLNASIWYLAQYIKMVPKKIREQASHVMCFRPTQECSEILCELYREPGMTKKQFMEILGRATYNASPAEKNFLYVNKSAEPNKRYRRNLETYLALDGDEPVPIELLKDVVKKKYRKTKKEKAKPVAEFPVPKDEGKIRLPSETYEGSEQKKIYLINGRRVAL